MRINHPIPTANEVKIGRTLAGAGADDDWCGRAIHPSPFMSGS